jgi:hypothetical protein
MECQTEWWQECFDFKTGQHLTIIRKKLMEGDTERAVIHAEAKLRRCGLK